MMFIEFAMASNNSATSRHTPGRVSVILWARKEQPEWKRLAATRPL